MPHNHWHKAETGDILLFDDDDLGCSGGHIISLPADGPGSGLVCCEFSYLCCICYTLLSVRSSLSTGASILQDAPHVVLQDIDRYRHDVKEPVCSMSHVPYPISNNPHPGYEPKAEQLPMCASTCGGMKLIIGALPRDSYVIGTTAFSARDG